MRSVYIALVVIAITGPSIYGIFFYAGSRGGSAIKIGPISDKSLSINIVNERITCFYHGAQLVGMTARGLFPKPRYDMEINISHPYSDSRMFVRTMFPIWLPAVGITVLLGACSLTYSRRSAKKRRGFTPIVSKGTDSKGTDSKGRSSWGTDSKGRSS